MPGIRREQNITRRTMSLLTQPSKLCSSCFQILIDLLPAARRTMRFWTGCRSLANTSSSRLNGTRGIVARRENPEAEDFEEVVESVFQKSYNTEQMCTNFILFILASSFLQTCELSFEDISHRTQRSTKATDRMTTVVY